MDTIGNTADIVIDPELKTVLLVWTGRKSHFHNDTDNHVCFLIGFDQSRCVLPLTLPYDPII